MRRWPAPQRGSDGGVGWGRFSRRVASVFKVDEKRMCFTWTDDEGDRVVVAAGDPSVARLEWEEAHRAVAERGLKALTLTVHATRADALGAAAVGISEAARAQGYSDDEVTAWRKQWEDWHVWHARHAATSGDAAAQGDERALDAAPNDYAIAELRAQNDELEAENAELEVQIAELKVQNDVLGRALDAAPNSAPP